MCAFAHIETYAVVPPTLTLPLTSRSAATDRGVGEGTSFCVFQHRTCTFHLLMNFCLRCFVWAIAARQSRAIRCRSGAMNARRKDFTGCRAFWASAGLRVHSATCARPDRTLPDGSANPPGPWRSGIAVIDTGARTTRHNKRRQRRLRSRATRQPGGSFGDGTAQPCSDPGLPAEALRKDGRS